MSTIQLSDEQHRALQRLVEGIKFHSHHNPFMSDNEPVFIAPNEDTALYELATNSGDTVKQGDLRTIASILQEGVLD